MGGFASGGRVRGAQAAVHRKPATGSAIDANHSAPPVSANTPKRSRSGGSAIDFPFTDEEVRAMPRSVVPSDRLSSAQAKVAESYLAFAQAEARETWQRMMRSASGTFAARRYIGDIADAEGIGRDALIEACLRWPLPCPDCRGTGRMRSAEGAEWACTSCSGSGKPRNDFKAFHAYLRGTVGTRVIEEANLRIRDCKLKMDQDRMRRAERRLGVRRVGSAAHDPQDGRAVRARFRVVSAMEHERLPFEVRRYATVMLEGLAGSDRELALRKGAEQSALKGGVLVVGVFTEEDERILVGALEECGAI